MAPRNGKVRASSDRLQATPRPGRSTLDRRLPRHSGNSRHALMRPLRCRAPRLNRRRHRRSPKRRRAATWSPDRQSGRPSRTPAETAPLALETSAARPAPACIECLAGLVNGSSRGLRPCLLRHACTPCTGGTVAHGLTQVVDAQPRMVGHNPVATALRLDPPCQIAGTALAAFRACASLGIAAAFDSI